MGEEVFQLHVATPTYATRPMYSSTGPFFLLVRNRVFFAGWCATGSSFPSCMKDDLLSLRVLHMVFFPCWRFTGSYFPACASQISFFKILLCQLNKTRSFREENI